MTTEADDWRPTDLFLALLALAVVGQFLSVRTGDVRIGPAFVASALAMALLGPAPAAVIAVTAVTAWSLNARTAWPLVLNNFAALTTYTVAGALAFQALGDPAADATEQFWTAAIVFGVYVASNFLNFVLIVGYLCLRDRTSLIGAIRRLYLPVFPWVVAIGTLTAGTVVAYQGDLGLIAIGMLAVILLSYRYLLGSVVDAHIQRDELRVAGGGARGPAQRRDPRDGRDARHARPHDGPPLRGGGALRQGDRGGGRPVGA